MRRSLWAVLAVAAVRWLIRRIPELLRRRRIERDGPSTLAELQDWERWHGLPVPSSIDPRPTDDDRQHGDDTSEGRR